MAADPTATDEAPAMPPLPGATWDGRALLTAVASAAAWLGINRDRINALNVFPVPDGDTGTNMLLTLRSALDEARQAAPEVQASAGAIAARLAFGALMGARGNSGIILSQICRGFAEAIAGRAEIDGRDLAAALAGSRDLAYRAVIEPVEGTMLSVIRAAAAQAERAAGAAAPLPDVLAAANRAALDALAETPNQLDLLRQAGVVDAGGQGIVCILEGMARFVRGDLVAPETPATTDGLGAEMAFLDHLSELHGEDAFGYCTNFMIFGEGIDFPRVRAELAAMGESAVIVGDSTVVKVHLHTLNPGRALEYALAFGELGQIKIDNMSAQTRALSAERQAATAPVVPRLPSPAPLPTGRQAILAVAAGEGLTEALRSMGATAVVRGQATEYPSTEELLAAIERIPGDEVLILPNDPNVLLTANEAARLTPKRARVVPSRSAPQGLAALEAFNAEMEIDQNAERMTAALGAIRTVALTRASRGVTVAGVAVAAGQPIALLDERLVAVGEDDAAALRRALAEAEVEAAELVTIFCGEGVESALADPLLEVIAEGCPEAEVEVLPGGQPHYRFIVGIQ